MAARAPRRRRSSPFSRSSVRLFVDEVGDVHQDSTRRKSRMSSLPSLFRGRAQSGQGEGLGERLVAAAGPAAGGTGTASECRRSGRVARRSFLPSRSFRIGERRSRAFAIGTGSVADQLISGDKEIDGIRRSGRTKLSPVAFSRSSALHDFGMEAVEQMRAWKRESPARIRRLRPAPPRLGGGFEHQHLAAGSSPAWSPQTRPLCPPPMTTTSNDVTEARAPCVGWAARGRAGSRRRRCGRARP